MKKFSWGQVIEKFTYDFDGKFMLVTKFHPWKSRGCTILTGDPDLESIQFHCSELHESSNELMALVISWIAFRNNGLNQQSLVNGVCRALEIYEVKP